MTTKPATIQSLIPMIDAGGIQDWETAPGVRETSYDIKYVVIHTTWLDPVGSDTSGGTATSNINFWKGNNNNQASAHYVIDGANIYQTVDDNNVAYHAGQLTYNKQSIGIEIVATASVAGTISTAELSACAQLVNYLCQTYNIPMVHTTGNDNSSDSFMLAAGIIGHSQVSLSGKTDPGPYFDWTNFINLVTGGNTAPSVTILAASSYAAGTVLTGTNLFSASDPQGVSDINHITLYDAAVTGGAVWRYNGAVITPGGASTGGFSFAYANRGLLTFTVGTGSDDFVIDAFDNAGAVSNDGNFNIT